MTAASLTIDLSAIVANWQALDRMTQVETGAVVKADAYGLGVAPVGRALARAGVRQFFVAQAQEGAELRHALGDGVEIFVFSGHMRGDTDTLVDLNLIPMLNSLDQMIRHFEGAPGAAFGIQLDTGMNRLGMEPQEWEAVREVALAQSPRLIISHLACADEPNNPMNAAQLSSFRAMTDGVGVPCSLAATGGLLLGSDYHFDMTRPGIGLYGGLPFAEAKPVVQLDLPAIQTRVVRPGETVGYACSWEAASPTSVTTVSAGYADGLPRSLGEGCTLWHEGTPCPVVGRISMDLITVDTSALREPPTQLSILCEDQSFDALADAAGTIGYEILTALGRRYTRRYRD